MLKPPLGHCWNSNVWWNCLSCRLAVPSSDVCLSAMVCMLERWSQFMIKLSVFKKKMFIFLLTILWQVKCWKYYFQTEIGIEIENFPCGCNSEDPKLFSKWATLIIWQYFGCSDSSLYQIIYYVFPVINQWLGHLVSRGDQHTWLVRPLVIQGW